MTLEPVKYIWRSLTSEGFCCQWTSGKEMLQEAILACKSMVMVRMRRT